MSGTAINSGYNSSFSQADQDLQDDIKRQSAYNASEINLFDQKTRRELWQSVFFHELQNTSVAARIELASGKAKDAVKAYDAQFAK